MVSFLAQHSKFFAGRISVPSIKRVVICNKCNVPLTDNKATDVYAHPQPVCFSTTRPVSIQPSPIQALKRRGANGQREKKGILC